MPEVIESKKRQNPRTYIPPGAKQVKLCPHCNKTRSFQDKFYNNRQWTQQLGKDLWCKDCFAKLKTKDELRQYFWENHRAWSQDMWQLAKKKAVELTVGNKLFQNSSQQRRATILQQLSVQQVASLMQTGFYKYFDSSKDSKAVNYQQAKQIGQIVQEEDPYQKIFSKQWNGSFTKHELQYLDNYYQQLEHDLNFQQDVSTRDYARKVSRASLQLDKTMDDYASGRCDYSAVKDAANVYDMLCKSANFAACKRKPQDTNNATSWSQTTFTLQTTGYLKESYVQWKPDDVDKSIAQLKHIVTAMGLDSI